MSYDGYTQNFCVNGHFWEEPVFGYSSKQTCPECNQPKALSNSVDDTNGERFGEIPPDQLEELMLTKATYEVCNLGHRHQTSPPVFRLPSQEELKSLRCYFDWHVEKWFPLPMEKEEE